MPTGFFLPVTDENIVISSWCQAKSIPRSGTTYEVLVLLLSQAEMDPYIFWWDLFF